MMPIYASWAAHRTGGSGAEDQSAHDEKPGNRSFHRWTHNHFLLRSRSARRFYASTTHRTYDLHSRRRPCCKIRRSGHINHQQRAAYTQKRAQWSAFSVLAVIAAFVAASAMASLAVPTNVAKSTVGVRLEGASSRAVVVGLRAVVEG